MDDQVDTLTQVDRVMLRKKHKYLAPKSTRIMNVAPNYALPPNDPGFGTTYSGVCLYGQNIERVMPPYQYAENRMGSRRIPNEFSALPDESSYPDGYNKLGWGHLPNMYSKQGMHASGPRPRNVQGQSWSAMRYADPSSRTGNIGNPPFNPAVDHHRVIPAVPGATRIQDVHAALLSGYRDIDGDGMPYEFSNGYIHGQPDFDNNPVNRSRYESNFKNTNGVWTVHGFRKFQPKNYQVDQDLEEKYKFYKLVSY